MLWRRSATLVLILAGSELAGQGSAIARQIHRQPLWVATATRRCRNSRFPVAACCPPWAAGDFAA